MNIKFRLFATALGAATALTIPAMAHESRLIPASKGNVRVTVGFLAEPAFEDSFNGLDLFLYTFDGRCPTDSSDFYGNPITSAEIINVQAEAIYFDKGAPPTGPLGSALPVGVNVLKTLKISNKSPVSRVYGDPGHYHSFYKPTHPGNPEQGGAYGFHVWGAVKTQPSEHACAGDAKPKPIPARFAKFDTYWVCEAPFSDGNPENRGRFNCIDPVQVFPGTKLDGYDPNGPFK